MKDLEYELKRTVEDWVDKTFNFIHVDVIRATLPDEYLQDYIIPLNPDYDDFFQNYNKHEEYKEWCEENEYKGSEIDDEETKQEFCEQDRDFESYNNDLQDNNNPMYNTCYEVRSQWDTLIEKAQDAGFGVIESTYYLNECLFVAGAGYSFIGHHFVPLYLSLFPEEAEKYKGVNYSHL